MRGLHAYSIVGVLWFVSVCCCFYGGQACLEEERKALLQLKDSINDYPNNPTYSVLEDWVGEDCCQWYRVSCSTSSSRVIGIGLFNARDPSLGVWYPNATLFAQFKELESLYLGLNQIGGWVMPEGFSQMKNLKILQLIGNMLNQSSQSLSGLCSLKRLKQLDLSDNQLDDRSLPSCLGNLSSLEDLILSYNNLRNPLGISTGLCGLKRLTDLRLSDNNLHDQSLPSCLGNLSSLQTLDLSENNLTFTSGAISTGLCGLKSLEYLDLAHNNLHDQSLASCLGNLSSLQTLDLSENNLTFTFGISTVGLCGLKRLTDLYLRDNNLHDQSLPSCLGNLSSLQTLDLSENNLTFTSGAISTGLCGLKRLTYLALRDNNLHDQSLPSCLGNLSSLENLDLSENNLTFTSGAISTGICKLRNLSRLNLMRNSIEGIHPCMEGMHNLQQLYLSDNRVTGKIPSFIFNNLTKIESIDLSNNQFMGVFSFSSFANLSQLSDVDLSNNVQLEVETQHPHWVPTFQLGRLSLENCNLNKHSTRTIPSFLSSQDNLYDLNLGHNSLKGIIPSWLLYNMSISSLWLMGNLLEGSIPQSTHNTTSSVSFLDISENNLSEPLPTNIGTLFPQLNYFNLSKNILQGRIPSSMGEIERLSILDLSSNNFSGEMPHQLTKNCTQLVYLNISSNRLQGDILPVDANLIRLQYLFASHNNFTRKIPSGLLNSPDLMILDIRKNTLSDTIPSWLFSLSKLVSILLGNNFFRGNIPIQLCQLSNLHTLDLSNNSFSGHIPSCLNNISSWKKTYQIQISYVSLNRTGFLPRPSTSFTTKGVTYFYEGLPFGLMTGIDLSMNQLQGDIPFQTGDLEALHSLNFSNNLLTGYLPQSFQNLKSLESLDLSHNKLFGRIPYELSQLDSLGAFSVAYNNLSGKIPFDKHLTTFGKDSYEGNPNLCGPPLERNCSLEISSQPPRDEEKNSRVLDNPVIFYSFVGMSYGLGFWGVIGFLILNKNGRHKYFRVMDAYIDRSIEKLSEFRSYLKNCCFKCLCGLKRLTYLRLRDNNLHDQSLPSCLGNLSSLQTLDLSGNNLTFTSGAISTGFCGLKRLTNLYLSNNNLDDQSLASCLGNLSSLQTLDLSWNNLTSTFVISTGLCFLKRLTRLDLRYNNLHDQSLASCLGNLSSLQTLDLSWNNLTFTSGAISTGLCGLKRLTYLRLRDNNLHDQGLASCLGNLSSLQTLDLSWNNLTFTSGAISTGLCFLKRLTRLDLSYNNLQDQSLPSCLGNLSSLQTLGLSGNNLTFTFGISTGLCGLKRLTQLDLSNNNLDDQSLASCLGNLSSLVWLDLSDNNLTFTSGAISTGICKLRNLNSLYLMSNSIEGIHPCMEGMHNLRQLFLSDNRVTGKIPSFIFNNLTKIESIDLSNNQFMGVFSFSTFANLSQLSRVDLSNNVQLEVETQHPHWVPTFQLLWLSLENCNLNKHSTHSIPSFLSSQVKLFELNLGHNSLKGIIPSWLLYNMSSDSLSLTGNLFEGSIPQSTHNTISSLTILDISENNLSGSLPTNIGTLFPQLNYFNLSKNILQGRIPSSMGEIKLFSILDLSSNNFSGEMPHQLTKNCTHLVYLNISSNRLQGDILPVDANLIRLQYLFASHNNFTGKIPSGLLNSPDLMILDMRKNTLSDTIPSWLFSLSKLVSILLGNNLFRGNIPIQLCQLSNLHTLDLSNNFFSGNIPSCLNNISSWKKTEQIQIYDVFLGDTFFHPRPSTSFTTKGVTYFYDGLPFSLMTGIDLSMNQLEGDIPFQIGDLGELLSLNFSNNRLTGHLPRSFQNLKSLESLDLSHNKLVGRIPYELSQLDSLGVFSVAYNNLSGKIPYEKHLTTFGNDSYEGNPNLCGPPIERKCSLEIPSQPVRDEGKNSRVLENPMIFYSFVAMSYALGFWGVIGFLILNKNWRHKYFRAMDAYIDWSIEKLSEFRCYLKNCCFK
ncbi:uncharacterized protein LOC143883257 [Tasmannia lanceolata]|uniref:uncharacterized protein LOC143883257 n=1 Tax=Tasmannia lanceolata TaxID=3420 RepID=UPI0040638E47